MAARIPNPPPGFDQLSIEEKLEYVESLWDRIAAKPETVPVPAWHLDVIDERLRKPAKPGDCRSWDELREELRSTLKRRKPSG